MAAEMGRVMTDRERHELLIDDPCTHEPQWFELKIMPCATPGCVRGTNNHMMRFVEHENHAGVEFFRSDTMPRYPHTREVVFIREAVAYTDHRGIFARWHRWARMKAPEAVMKDDR